MAIRSRALTIPRPHALTTRRPPPARTIRPPTQRRELIPLRAAAIPLRLAPIQRPAAAIAVEEVAEALAVVEAAGARTAAEAEVALAAEALTAVEVAEVLMAVEAPALTAAITNLFADSAARLDAPGGPFVFYFDERVNFRSLASSVSPIVFGITRTQLFRPFGVT